jgi:hypothetical protein
MHRHRRLPVAGRARALASIAPWIAAAAEHARRSRSAAELHHRARAGDQAVLGRRE